MTSQFSYNFAFIRVNSIIINNILGLNLNNAGIQKPYINIDSIFDQNYGQGGLAFFQAVDISINNLVIDNSMAFNGGALYINLINDASLILTDGNFNNSFA